MKYLPKYTPTEVRNDPYGFTYKEMSEVIGEMNSTPFVRQYGILLTNGVLLYAERSAEQEVCWGIQTGSR